MVEGSPCDDPANRLKRDELLINIRRDLVVVVTGTGVSLQSGAHPAGGEVGGWPGLLRHGLEHCLKLYLLDRSAAEIVDMQIKNGTADCLIDAAQKIHQCLDHRINGRYWWLKESVGEIRVIDPRLVLAIQGLGALIATLNYDSLLQKITNRPPIHWRQQTEITRLLRQHSKGFILHLHGHWESPDSVILDRRSYERISADVNMHDLLRRFARFETLVFVGCGQTFFDPDFQTLLNWGRAALEGVEHRHFILCRQSDEPKILAQLKEYGFLTTLVYGTEYSDLAPFLEELGREAGSTATASNPLLSAKSAPMKQQLPRFTRPSDIWKLQSLR